MDRGLSKIRPVLDLIFLEDHHWHRITTLIERKQDGGGGFKMCHSNGEVFRTLEFCHTMTVSLIWSKAK